MEEVCCDGDGFHVEARPQLRWGWSEVEKRKSRPLRVEDAVRRFLSALRSTRNLSEHTHRAYRTDLNDFQTFLGPGKTVSQCQKEVIESYLRHLLQERKLKETSVKRRLASLRLLFSWLEEEDGTENPFHRLRVRIKLPKRLPRVLSRDEVRRLLRQPAKELQIFRDGSYDLSRLPQDVSDQEFLQLSMLVALELLFATGVRVGELTEIRLPDLDLKDGVVRIHGKGSRQRRVFLAIEPISSLLDRYLSIRNRRSPATKRLLILPSNSFARTHHVRRWVRVCAEKAGLRRSVTPHMLRHTAATQLLEAGLDIRFVQCLLGHQSIATTQIYTAVSDLHLKGLVCARHPRRTLYGSGP